MEIEFRPATDGDLELLLAWRNNPKLYERFSEQDAPIAWGSHVDWWESRSDRRDWIITVREDAGRWRDVGSVNLVDLNEDEPEVGVYVGEIQSWGKGIATAALEFALDWLSEQDYVGARATILEENLASQRLFEKVGFTRTGKTSGGAIEYQYRI